MKKGKITTTPSEAKQVPEIFNMYLQGNSIGVIAKNMNESSMPYSESNPKWDKHKIRRLLENEAYVGENGYPAIIPQELFDKVRQRYEQKSAPKAEIRRSDEKPLWRSTYCAECGRRMPRVGIYSKACGRIVLACTNPECGNRIDMLRDEFIQSIRVLMDEISGIQKRVTEYEPSQNILRLTAEINRLIEKPTEEKMVQAIILQAAAERYACCPGVEEGIDATIDGIDWQRFKELVDRVEIGKDCTIRITGK